MEFSSTQIDGLYIIKPRLFGDKRGWFMESWSSRTMNANGFSYTFVQDNHSYSSSKGTLRGIHFQKGKDAQAKLIRCIRGAILDVAVDLRKKSPTFLKWLSFELSAENNLELLLPRGFGHAFVTLTNDVEILYKADNFYEPGSEGSVIWNDPQLKIDWGIRNPLLSEKDARAPRLCDSDFDFEYCREKEG